MFDFAWSEILLIGGIALIAIGPKDLPIAIKTVAELIKKARRMAGEFQTHVDEMVREANLHEVKNTFDDLRRMDIKGKILDAVDTDGGIRKTLADRPFDINPAPPPVPVHDTPALEEMTVAAREAHSIYGPPEAGPEAAPVPPRDERPPAFLPPSITAAGRPKPPPPPPAFVPPHVVAQRAPKSRAPYA